MAHGLDPGNEQTEQQIEATAQARGRYRGAIRGLGRRTPKPEPLGRVIAEPRESHRDGRLRGKGKGAE